MNRLVIGLLGVAALGTGIFAACSSDSGSSGTPTTTVAQDVTDQDLMALMAQASVGTPQLPSAQNDDLVELGRMLFHDKELSGNRDIACSTCHSAIAGSSDNLPIPVGVGGVGSNENRNSSTPARFEYELMHRSAPSIFNVDLEDYHVLFWDGKVKLDPAGGFDTPQYELNGPMPVLPHYTAVFESKLAALAMFPATPSEEMRGRPGENELADLVGNVKIWEGLMKRIVGTEDPNDAYDGFAEYRTLFFAAYPNIQNADDFTFAHAANAIRAFINRTFTSLDSPYDDYLAGDMNALTQQEKNGAALFFGEAGCASCHNGEFLTDFNNYATGIPQVGPGTEDDVTKDDLGRYLRTLAPSDRYKFRVPPLRNIALSGPYGHSGAYPTLRGMIKHKLDPHYYAQNYDVTQLPERYRDLYNDRQNLINARVSRIDSFFAQPRVLTESQIDDLVAFMHSFTDPGIEAKMIAATPATVPSGLPVAD